MFSSAEMQLIYKVANAPVHLFPYPHILVHDVFPENFYRELLAQLPPRSAYKSLKAMGRVKGDYSDARGVLLLAPHELAQLSDPYRGFWEALSQWLLGQRFAQALLQRFSPVLAYRFADLAAIQFYSEAMLIQDNTHYQLGPHTDAPSKVLSLLFYLPADASAPHLGTSMYLPKDAAFGCPGGRHHSFKDFDRILTMPYVPNTLFAFMKTPNAFHGVEPIGDADTERKLLLYDVSVRDVPSAQPSGQQTKAQTKFSF